MKLIKFYRPLNDKDSKPVTEVSELDIPLDMRTPIPDEYHLHVGVGFNADMLATAITEALENQDICMKICSPMGLSAKALNDPAQVFAHMDKMLPVHEALGGFHEVNRGDFNVYNLIEMGNKLARKEAYTEVDAVTINQETGKFEEKKCQILNFPGYVQIMSANPVWRKCLSWLPFSELQGSGRIMFGASLISAMVDPRWYVNRRSPLDVSILRQYFGLRAISDHIAQKDKVHFTRSLIPVNTWWWMPQGTDLKEVVKQPNGYFHRLFGKYMRQLSNRFPPEMARNIALLFTTQKFLSFIWLNWMNIICDEKIFQFNPSKFFYDSPEAAESFSEHYALN